MTFAESLGTYLASYAGLAALVSNRIFPVRAPDQCQLPYVVYRLRIEPENTLTNSPIDIAHITISVFSRESTVQSAYAQAHAIADQVRDALAFFKAELAAGGLASEGSLVMSVEDGDAAEFGILEAIVEAEMGYCRE